jgi:hypothetical protein
MNVRIRRHLSYANVTATVALFVALGGGAYAIDKVDSRDIANGTIRSIDLKNRKAVNAVDVKRNALRGRQISEETLDADRFAPVAGSQAAGCDPSSSNLVDCVTTTIRLKERSHMLVIVTGGEESVSAPAHGICRVRIDGAQESLAVAPGEKSINTSGAATNGFARTIVTSNELPRGKHKVALACGELLGNVRFDAPTIAAIAIGSR